MPKISDARRAERRDQILDAALSCFAERGFQATSMADIISASGLSAGAIYLYFAGKGEIARAVAERVASGIVGGALRAGRSGPPPSPGTMIRMVGERLDQEDVPSGLPVQIWGEAATDPEFRRIPAEVFEMLGREYGVLLERWFAAETGRSGVEARGLVEQWMPVLLALTQGYILQRALVPGFDEAQYLAAVERVFAAGASSGRQGSGEA